jgi:hypothetical protein
LAFQGIDSRDLYRRGSGLTLRRLYVLLKALPWDSPLYEALRAEAESAKKPKADEIRERAAAFKARNAARLAKEREESADG